MLIIDKGRYGQERYSYTFTLYVLYCLTLRLISAPTQTIKGLYILCSSMRSTDKNWPPWSRIWSLCITITDHDVTEDISTYIKGMELCPLTRVWEFVVSCCIYQYSSMFIIVWQIETVPATVLWVFFTILPYPIEYRSYSIVRAHCSIGVDSILFCVIPIKFIVPVFKQLFSILYRVNCSVPFCKQVILLRI